jgi:dihydrofolate synthase/folylpolyglutamate synthase
MTRLTYQEALDYLYSFVDYSQERSYRYSAEVFDLARMQILLKRLGDPQDAYPTVHVAGTKGKGSVSSLIASSLTAAGYGAGLYTSPHLIHFTERIRIGPEEIPEEALADLVDELKPHVAQVPGLTTFCGHRRRILHFACRAVTHARGRPGAAWATNMLTPHLRYHPSYDHTTCSGTSLEIAVIGGH